MKPATLLAAVLLAAATPTIAAPCDPDRLPPPSAWRQPDVPFRIYIAPPDRIIAWCHKDPRMTAELFGCTYLPAVTTDHVASIILNGALDERELSCVLLYEQAHLSPNNWQDPVIEAQAPDDPAMRSMKQILGRHPKEETVIVNSAGQSRSGHITEDRTRLEFRISPDIIERLFELHDAIFMPHVYGFPKRRSDRYKVHRLEFARLRDIGIPGILIRIEAPTYDPHGHRLRVKPGARSFVTTIVAHKLRVRPNIPQRTLETMWMDTARGLLCIFPDEDMEDVGEVPKLPKRVKRQRRNQKDLTVQ